MNRGTFAILYMLISSIINIIYTLVVCAIVVVVSMVSLKYLFHPNPELFVPVLTGVFVIGLIISFVTYSKISMKVIKKYKLDEKFAARGKPKSQSGEKSEPKKTVLPDSVKEEEEDEKWRE